MDPLLQPGDLGQANRYLYVGGNPVNGVDPAGLSFIGNFKKIGSHVLKSGATYGGVAGAFGATGGCAFGWAAGPPGCLAVGGTAGTAGLVGGTVFGTVKGLVDVARKPSKYRGN